MRLLLPLLAALPFALRAQLQWPICDTLSIAYDQGSVVFTEADMSFGDSMIVVQVINTSTANMAYPQLKLFPQSPLPPGMVQNTGWYTFASAWNMGDTMPAHCYFDVAAPIPPDFTVTFAVYANNLSPLLADSCYFSQPILLNLNPWTTAVTDVVGDLDLSVWPLPAQDALNVRLPSSVDACALVLLDLRGGPVREMVLSAGARSVLLDTSAIPSGMYVLSMRYGTGEVVRCVVAVAH